MGARTSFGDSIFGSPGAKDTWALLRVSEHRFRIFNERFGRDPEPDEPLFFDPSKDRPVAADPSETMEQVIAAASAAKVDARPVLKFLGFEQLKV
jgi:hypothetical protein